MSTTVDVSNDDQVVRMAVAQRSDPAPENEPAAPATKDPPTSRPPRAPAPRFAVGDYVFTDLARSGRQEGSRGAAGRISVQLLDRLGDVVDSTVTTSSGRYVFDHLSAGTYSVRFAGLPGGYKLSSAGQGGDRGLDSDPDFTGVTPPFTLGVGEPNVRAATAADGVAAAYINPTIDAGITALRYAVGDQVWLDSNRDGVRQPEEPAATASVALLSDRHVVVATTTTDAQGHYQFTDLASGRYQLRFSGLPAHRALTTPRSGRDADAGSAPDPRTGLTAVFRLDPSAPGLVPAADAGMKGVDLVDVTLDAGLVPVYSLGDTVWRDQDGNALRGPDDHGVAGVRVRLLDPAGKVLATRTTASNGRFAFTRLAGGRYRLRFDDLPAGLVFTTPRVGPDRTLDSDADADGLTPVITVGDDNPADTTVDAALTVPGNANASAAAGAASATAAVDSTLPGTGGPPAEVPAGGVLLVLAGMACLLIGSRRARRVLTGMRPRLSGVLAARRGSGDEAGPGQHGGRGDEIS